MSEKCPMCGGPGPFSKVEVGLKVALQSTGQADELPAEVCKSCLEDLSSKVSQGVKIRMEEEAKHKNKIQLWKNRVTYVKQGRTLMQKKAFPEAAMSFEKYLKILELVYDVSPGGLNPEIFSNSTRSKEMTIIASVYWDLIRIYDTHKRYNKRLTAAVSKLLIFGKYSSAFPSIVKKAESFARNSKNPNEIKRIVKAGKGGKGCWIATVSFGDPDCHEVVSLRRFRDQTLNQHWWGRSLIRFYYSTSPYIAQQLDRSEGLKRFSRKLLKILLKILP